MQARPFAARLLYTIGGLTAGTQVQLAPGGWNLDAVEYEVVGTELRLREHEFERISQNRQKLERQGESRFGETSLFETSTGFSLPPKA